MATAFDWPAIDGVKPVWTGSGFQVGQARCAILTYGAAASGWSEALTDFHERTAGEGTHPIDIASRRHAVAALRRHLGVAGAAAVLLVAEWPESLVIGSDFIEGPLLRLAESMPSLPLLRFDLTRCPRRPVSTPSCC